MIRKPKTFETVFETKFERTMTSKETSEAIALIEENFKSCESTKTDKRKGSVHHTRIVLGLNALNRRIEELEMVIMVRDACALLFRSLLQRTHLYNPQCTDLKTASQQNLIKHIPFLCASNDVPLYGIDRASFVLTKVFRVKRIAAFGITKDRSTPTSATSTDAVVSLKRLLPRALNPKSEWFGSCTG